MAENTTTEPGVLGRAWDWLKAHERGVLLTTAALQVVVLGAMIVIRSLPLWLGETVLLRVQPLDPRDLFRGDYVILTYEMNRMPVEGLPADAYDRHDDRAVYVTLEPEADGRHWRPVKASLTPPASGKYIKGKYAAGMLRFGIEAYYVQEGTGLEFERAIGERRLSAEVALTSWGQATLRRLHVEEKATKKQ